MAGQNQRVDVRWEDEKYVRGVVRHIRQMTETSERDVLAAGIKVTNYAKRFAPVRTGAMKNGITWEEGRDAKGYFLAVLSRQPYWKYVEFGTRSMSAQPFMRPAFVAGLEYLRERVARRRG
jgi:HK97 gp10 family phage protein